MPDYPPGASSSCTQTATRPMHMIATLGVFRRDQPTYQVAGVSVVPYDEARRALRVAFHERLNQTSTVGTQFRSQLGSLCRRLFANEFDQKVREKLGESGDQNVMRGIR